MFFSFAHNILFATPSDDEVFGKYSNAAIRYMAAGETYSCDLRDEFPSGNATELTFLGKKTVNIPGRSDAETLTAPDRNKKMRIDATVRFDGEKVGASEITHIPALRIGLFAGKDGKFAGLLAVPLLMVRKMK